MNRTYRLLVSCPDATGIVATVSDFIARHGGWIVEANHHSDPVTRRFYMRNEIKADSLPFSLDEFKHHFTPVAEKLSLDWRINDSGIPQRVALLASKEAHCLSDLLYRWRSGDLNMEIPCVISNHEDLRSYVEWHGIPYHHVPVDKGDKASAFEAMTSLLEQYRVDTVVLARYMQILPPQLCEQYADRVINIHHSFLPSFVGAKPYHQAYERGVKLVGATCHYVTEILDAGPIIEQDVIRVGHHHLPEDMVRLGKDVEKSVLARGLRYHIEDRVIVDGSKTIILG
ncbi:formyltetrahydrofolate deformylase [Endozoicomonas sp. GU-1]|uniref:formyltetrahydrofolate deformylase n=1 Tax=Endozoicomonas sp. GU-1 TaxID=3009078 RepID=UPI0022B56231|nr:formyltetrahydrofolate deformylase [Endozoicomonas sp. GU-1]WBA81664.1 formyltetrahydrofolate deformylase [Endozoicomonas sp. GU-1]WBA84618.1 formyltetrahydrofolate deformylase [Endozoicomonas sp. GU-1]